jgi:hypothetical protein
MGKRLIINFLLVFSLSGCVTSVELVAEMYKECLIRDGETSCDSLKKAFSHLS